VSQLEVVDETDSCIIIVYGRDVQTRANVNLWWPLWRRISNALVCRYLYVFKYVIAM